MIMKKSIFSLIALFALCLTANAQSDFNSNIEQVNDSTLKMTFTGTDMPGWKSEAQLSLEKVKGLTPAGELRNVGNNTFVQLFHMDKRSYKIKGTLTHTESNGARKIGPSTLSFDESATNLSFHIGKR